MDSSLRKANSREYQWQVIDAKINVLEESIRALRRRRNAVVPISSLPTEVIAVIFSLSRLFDAPLLADGKLDHLAWLRVTHVCHQWREIALNNPLFWNHIDFTNITSAGAAEMLVRAKKAPLHLEAWATGDHRGHTWFNAFKKVLPSRVTNICHLEIGADVVFLRRTIKRLTSPALTLESLSLSTEENYLVTPSRATIPDTLFGGTAPRLSSLKLYKCNISWKSPLLKGLSSLEIHAPSRHVRPSLADWLDTLDEMQQLKLLALDSASPIAPPFPLDIKRTVTLPFLTDLIISSSAGECTLALSHLLLPVLTQLRIEAKSVLGGSDVLNLLPYVAAHSHGPQDTQPLQTVDIHGERKRIEILAYSDPNHQSYDLSFFMSVVLYAPRVALSITCQFTTEILDAAMTALSLDNLVKLTVLGRKPLDELFWYTWAPRWPLLKWIRLAPLAARGFREMILQDNGGHENPLLPSLIVLSLSKTTLTSPRTLRLRDALMKRVDQGVPLELLDLLSCNATSAAGHSLAVGLLNEIVVDVLVRKAPYSGPFVDDNDSGAEDYSDSEDESEPHSSDDDEEGDDDEIDDEEDDEEDYGATDGD